MEFLIGPDGRVDRLAELFRETFTQSEGEEEGTLIGALARALMAETPEDDIAVFTAEDAGTKLGSIIFSRLRYAGDDREVFILGPVAVTTDRQGEGIGQALLRHGLAEMSKRSADYLITYGDPRYYTRVGFRPITEAFAPAPFPLQFPEGWQGYAPEGRDVAPFEGRPVCVAAFNDPAFW